MKKIFSIINFIVLLIPLVIWSSCTSINSDDVTKYKLNIVITDKLIATKNNGYPDDIINICKPIDTVCDEKNYTPTPIKILRIGERGEVISTKDLEVLADNVTNLKSHENSVDAFFIKRDGKKIDKTLVSPNSDNVKQNEVLDIYLKTLGIRDKVFYYSQNARSDSVNNHILYNDVEKLKYAISNYLCENPKHNIVIVFNPFEIVKVDSSIIKYNKLVNEADELFNKQKYLEAKKKYIECQTIKMDDKHVNDRIREIISIIDKMKEKNPKNKKITIINKATKEENQKIIALPPPNKITNLRVFGINSFQWDGSMVKGYTYSICFYSSVPSECEDALITSIVIPFTTSNSYTFTKKDYDNFYERRNPPGRPIKSGPCLIGMKISAENYEDCNFKTISVNFSCNSQNEVVLLKK